VVLVNETLARRLAGGAPLVGRDVKFAVKDFEIRGAETAWSVVGIVADARDGGPRAAVQPEVYLPMAQGPAGVFDWIGRQVLVAVRSETGRSIDAAALRAAVAGAEPGLALYDVLTLGERFREHVATERLLTGVLVPLGATSFGLSAFGIFTLLMQLVVGRRRELAIRMALGATSRRVVRSLVGEGFSLTAWGMVLGLIGAMVVSQAIRPLMFGISPSDPTTIAVLILMTALTTLLAIWIPAQRAVSVDPAAVLRAE
jgi:predicted lysophospholipase L1 biosynthesis ABC-type transport system permease subunit